MTDAPETAKKRGRPRKAHTAAVSADLAIVETQITAERAVAEQRLAQLNAFPLDSQERVDMFGRCLIAIRQEHDKLDEQRKHVKAPSLESCRRIDALFKPVLDLHKAMDKLIVARLGEVRGAAVAAQSKALEAVAGGDRAPETLAAAHGHVAVPEGLSECEDLEIEVVDLALVPLQLHMLDEPLTRKYLKMRRDAGKAEPEIPGLKITTRASYRRNGAGK